MFSAVRIGTSDLDVGGLASRALRTTQLGLHAIARISRETAIFIERLPPAFWPIGVVRPFGDYRSSIRTSRLRDISRYFRDAGEISVCSGMRGGDERTQTACQARSRIEPVSMRPPCPVCSQKCPSGERFGHPLTSARCSRPSSPCRIRRSCAPLPRASAGCPWHDLPRDR